MELNININEFLALIFSVSIGTAGYISFLRYVKKEKPNFGQMIMLFFLNLFVAHTFSEIMKYYNWGDARSAFLPFISFSGLYIVVWFDKRREKIFDAGAKKVGLNIDKEEEEQKEEKNTTDE